MNNDNKRVIHTKLYSNIAKEILDSVEGQLSDGMWENSPAMEKYWRFSNVTTAPDGEVIIEIKPESSTYDKYGAVGGKWTSNGFHDMTDAEVIKWFAAKVKHIMQAEIKDDGHQLMKAVWSRYNGVFETKYLSYGEKITVRDVYFVYDFLMGRDVDKKYNGDMSLKIVSAPKSDEETKAEETRRANLAKLQAEWTAARQKLDEEKRAKIKLVEEEFDRNVRLLNAEHQARYEALRA